MDKFSLIYEFDNSSPTFVKVAYDELKKNHFEKSISILDKGLATYPEYSTAYIVYALALANAGNYDDARNKLEKYYSIVEDKDSYEFYLAEIEKAKEKKSFVEESRRVSFIDEPFEENSSNKSEDDELEDLAKKLENAKIDIKEIDTDVIEEINDNEESPEDEVHIVSETIASIYVAQGNYKQAIEVYRKLIDQDPAKKEFFETKISELEKKISDLENSDEI